MKLTFVRYLALSCLIVSLVYIAGSTLRLDPAYLHQSPRTCVDPINEPFIVSDESGSDAGWPEAWPEVAVSNDGTQLVVVYSVLGKYGDGWAVAGRRFDLSGTPLGDEFLVDVGGNSEDPSIDFDHNGNFSIAWHSSGRDEEFDGGHSIYLREYSEDGKEISPIALVPQDLQGNQFRPTNLVLSDGTSLITWYSESSPVDGSSIRGRLFKAGEAISDEFHISTAQDRTYKQWRMGHASKNNFFISVWWDDGLEPRTLRRLLNPDPFYLARVIDHEGNFGSDVLRFPKATDFVIDDSGNWIGNSAGLAQWHTSDGNSIGWPFPLHEGEFSMRANGDFIVYGTDGCVWPYTASGNLVSDPISMGGWGYLAHTDGNDRGDVVATWDNALIPGPSRAWDIWVSISSVSHLVDQVGPDAQGVTLINLNKTIPYTAVSSLLTLVASVYLLRRPKPHNSTWITVIGLTLNIVGSYFLWMYAGALIGGVVGRVARYHETAAICSLFVALAAYLTLPSRRRE